MDRLLLNQRAPSTACFESLLLDSLLLLNERSATVQDLLSSMKSNPFINSSNDTSLLSVGEGGEGNEVCRQLRTFYITICLSTPTSTSLLTLTSKASSIRCVFLNRLFPRTNKQTNCNQMGQSFLSIAFFLVGINFILIVLVSLTRLLFLFSTNKSNV